VYALYEALLLAALGVDRGRSRVLGLFAAHGERDAGECRGEGGYRELHVTGLVSPMFNSTPKYAHCIFCDRSKLPSLSFFAQSIAEAYPELRGMLIALFLLNNALGERTTCEPTWRPIIVYIATIFAVFEVSSVRRGGDATAMYG
jgi:hypothetical protein